MEDVTKVEAQGETKLILHRKKEQPDSLSRTHLHLRMISHDVSTRNAGYFESVVRDKDGNKLKGVTQKWPYVEKTPGKIEFEVDEHTLNRRVVCRNVQCDKKIFPYDGGILRRELREIEIAFYHSPDLERGGEVIILPTDENIAAISVRLSGELFDSLFSNFWTNSAPASVYLTLHMPCFASGLERYGVIPGEKATFAELVSIDVDQSLGRVGEEWAVPDIFGNAKPRETSKHAEKILLALDRLQWIIGIAAAFLIIKSFAR
ncbi:MULTISPECIES: hypothetical protein [Microvirga]|uniref:hypothetical protein n=1 Tax=Microvirga TaxID=186650 RepID=UPI0021C91963|nr:MULTISPECIES: hypothetical protein [unclassified Microvirga]